MEKASKAISSLLIMDELMGGNILKQFTPIPCKTCQYQKLGLETICNKYPKRIPISVKDNRYCEFYKRKEPNY